MKTNCWPIRHIVGEQCAGGKLSSIKHLSHCNGHNEKANE